MRSKTTSDGAIGGSMRLKTISDDLIGGSIPYCRPDRLGSWRYVDMDDDGDVSSGIRAHRRQLAIGFRCSLSKYQNVCQGC